MATGNPALLMHLTLLRSRCLPANLLNADFLAHCPSSAALSPPAPGADDDELQCWNPHDVVNKQPSVKPQSPAQALIKSSRISIVTPGLHLYPT